MAKLSQVSAAKKACPELVIVDGEDLTPFRDVSKRLHRVLKVHSWNGKVERLGLDEVFMGTWHGGVPLRSHVASSLWVLMLRESRCH